MNSRFDCEADDVSTAVPAVAAVLEGGCIAGGVSAVTSVNDVSDGEFNTVRGEIEVKSTLLVFKDSETREVVVVLSMLDEARSKSRVESSPEQFFRLPNMFLTGMFNITFSSSSMASLMALRAVLGWRSL